MRFSDAFWREKKHVSAVKKNERVFASRREDDTGDSIRAHIMYIIINGTKSKLQRA